MLRSRCMLAAAAAVLVITSVCSPSFFAQDKSPQSKGAEPALIHIGIVDSLVKELSPGKKDLIKSDFPSLVMDFTGFKSDAILGGDPFAAAKEMSAGKWHLGVFQGVEFAWIQSKDDKIQPLILAIRENRVLHALLVVKKDRSYSGFTDLKGKDIHILQSREHCRLFAEKGAGGDLKSFFGKAARPSSYEAALDDVLKGKVEAAVVDNSSLDAYKELQPGRFARLKVIAKSEPFPPIVIAYYQGVLSDRVLGKFREGMVLANNSDKGRKAMENVDITAFDPVPGEFGQMISNILKAYPPPQK